MFSINLTRLLHVRKVFVRKSPWPMWLLHSRHSTIFELCTLPSSRWRIAVTSSDFTISSAIYPTNASFTWATPCALMANRMRVIFHRERLLVGIVNVLWALPLLFRCNLVLSFWTFRVICDGNLLVGSTRVHGLPLVTFSADYLVLLIDWKYLFVLTVNMTSIGQHSGGAQWPSG